MTKTPIAVLYQALPPPVIDGLRKDAKPGGYSDSGADIAFVLRGLGHAVVTPAAAPDPAAALDWVFPDTPQGLRQALDAGAQVLWANTVLFDGHPLQGVLDAAQIVGQPPRAMERFDDKFRTNAMLATAGLNVAWSVLAAQAARGEVLALTEVEAAMAAAGVAFPVIIKPVRGRGSQGVRRVANRAELVSYAARLIDGGAFGDTVIVEEYLAGEELTVTVMPPASPRPDGTTGPDHWPLRPVRRFNQRDGVAPYNGDVAVTENSAAIEEGRLADAAMAAMLADCVQAARLTGARSAIRIDCREAGDGTFKLFDLNMKPNMTGPGRPGRDAQDCLSAIAARAEGWSYGDLLQAMLAAAWTGAAADA